MIVFPASADAAWPVFDLLGGPFDGERRRLCPDTSRAWLPGETPELMHAYRREGDALRLRYERVGSISDLIEDLTYEG